MFAEIVAVCQSGSIKCFDEDDRAVTLKVYKRLKIFRKQVPSILSLRDSKLNKHSSGTQSVFLATDH